MLRFFRGGGVAQIVVGGIVSAIIVVFALEFRAGRGSSTANLQRDCAVDFDGNCVDAKDYGASFALIAPRGLDPKQVKSLGLRQRVLDGLVERELLVAAAKKEGLGVSDEAVEAELVAGRAHVSLPAELAPSLAPSLGLCLISESRQGCEPGTPMGVRALRVKRTEAEPFDYKLYEREVRILTNRGPKEFRAMQERELIADRMRALVASRVRVPESEALMLFERGRTRATVRSVRLEQSWFMKHGIDQSDAAVNAWAASNAAQVDEAWKAAQAKYTAGCPLVREIAVTVPPLALDDERAPLKQKIVEARERVAKGESFEAVAREVSDAPSAAFGGRIGCLNDSYGLGADVLLKAATAAKPGELSDVIETPRGLHVIEVTGKLDPANIATEGRLSVARNLYARFAADEAMRKFADQLIQDVKGGAKLEEASDALAKALVAERGQKPAKAPKKDKAEETPLALRSNDKPTFEISPPFNVSGNPLPDVEPREPIALRAFELKQPEEVYAKPIETATGLLVIQLKEKTVAKREDFEKEKWPILRALRQAKANDAVTRYVADLRAAAGDKLKIGGHFGEDPKGSEQE
jgi:parvulin-like peptidyl-prolyl isomerase